MVDNCFSREELFQSFVLLILLLDRSLLRRFRCGSVWKHLLSSDWGESCSQRQRVLLLCVLLFKCARSVWIMREVFCCFGGSFLGQILFKKFIKSALSRKGVWKRCALRDLFGGALVWYLSAAAYLCARTKGNEYKWLIKPTQNNKGANKVCE